MKVEQIPFNPNNPDDKLTKEMRKEIADAFEEAKRDLASRFTIEETPDVIEVRSEDEGGESRTMGFTKVGDTMPVEGVSQNEKISDIIAARMRFPNDPVDEALRKLKALRKSKESPAQEKKGD